MTPVTLYPPLADIERYYDAVPRPVATTEEVGPFTLFLAAEGTGWEFYARPRLGLDQHVTADDVRRVFDRQVELDEAAHHGVGRPDHADPPAGGTQRAGLRGLGRRPRRARGVPAAGAAARQGHGATGTTGPGC